LLTQILYAAGGDFATKTIRECFSLLVQTAQLDFVQSKCRSSVSPLRSTQSRPTSFFGPQCSAC